MKLGPTSFTTNYEVCNYYEANIRGLMKAMGHCYCNRNWELWFPRFAYDRPNGDIGDNWESWFPKYDKEKPVWWYNRRCDNGTKIYECNYFPPIVLPTHHPKYPGRKRLVFGRFQGEKTHRFLGGFNVVYNTPRDTLGYDGNGFPGAIHLRYPLNGVNNDSFDIEGEGEFRGRIY